MKADSERYLHVDIARGIGIVLVVMGHKGMHLFGILPAFFHMPLFFFISGYLFSPRTHSAFFSAKVRNLLIPMYAYVVVYSLAYYIAIRTEMLPGSYPNWFHGVLVDPFLNAHGMPFTLALWFVAALFLANVLFHFFHIHSRGSAVLACLVGLVLNGSLVLAPGDCNASSFVARDLMGFGWMCLGYAFRAWEPKLSPGRWTVLACAVYAATSVYLAPDKNYIMMICNDYQTALLAPLLFGLSASIAIVSLSRFLDGNLGRCLAGMGRESFHIMANHMFVFFMVNLLFVFLLQDGSWLEDVYSMAGPQLRHIYFFAGLLIPWQVVSRIRRAWRGRGVTSSEAVPA